MNYFLDYLKNQTTNNTMTFESISVTDWVKKMYKVISFQGTLVKFTINLYTKFWMISMTPFLSFFKVTPSLTVWICASTSTDQIVNCLFGLKRIATLEGMTWIAVLWPLNKMKLSLAATMELWTQIKLSPIESQAHVYSF